MTKQTACPAKEERYANLIPMKELQFEKDRLFPFPIYEKLRKSSPVRYDKQRDCWDVFKYDDVQFVLKNPKLFSSKRGIQAESILTMDPPKTYQITCTRQQIVYSKGSETNRNPHKRRYSIPLTGGAAKRHNRYDR